MTKDILRTPAIIICHGKSEKLIAEYLKSNLKIPIAIEAENKGNSSIQIGRSLMKVLKNSKFRDLSGFKQYYSDVQLKRGFPQNLTIFPVMDLDDASPQVIQEYKNGGMFSQHWLKDIILPIYNDGNLEDSFKAMGLPYEVKHNKKVAKYIQVFPRNDGSQDVDTVSNFYQSCHRCSRTNMDVMIRYLLEYAESKRNPRFSRS